MLHVFEPVRFEELLTRLAQLGSEKNLIRKLTYFQSSLTNSPDVLLYCRQCFAEPTTDQRGRSESMTLAYLIGLDGVY